MYFTLWLWSGTYRVEPQESGKFEVISHSDQIPALHLRVSTETQALKLDESWIGLLGFPDAWPKQINLLQKKNNFTLCLKLFLQILFQIYGKEDWQKRYYKQEPIKSNKIKMNAGGLQILGLSDIDYKITTHIMFKKQKISFKYLQKTES